MSDQQRVNRPAPGGPMGGPLGRMMGAGPVEKSRDFRGSGRRVLERLRPQRGLVAAAVALTGISVSLSVAGPKILARATDLVYVGATHRSIDFGAVGRVLGVALGSYALASVLSATQGQITALVVQRTVLGLRDEVEAKLARLPLRYFDDQPRGEVLSRVTNDIDNVAQTLQQTMGQLITSVLSVVGVLAMMLWTSWMLAIVALVTVPISMGMAAAIGRRAQPQFVAQWKATGRLNGHVEEMFSGHALVRVFGRQREAAEQFAKFNQEVFDASFRAQFVSGTIQPAMQLVGNAGYVLVAVLGGLRVAHGAMSIGDVQAFVQYSRQFTQPLAMLASMANLLQSGVASAERVFQLLDAAEQSPDPPWDRALPAVAGRVVFDRVSFRYRPDQALIEDLSLTVEPGSTVAIVGPTGAGKTTLVNLLLRFYELDGGRITIDGVDIATMSREQVRSVMGLVLQDAWVFGGTIAENIAYGRLGATADEIAAAARATHVDRFVRTLPDGYATRLDDEGSNVSAGEKQLLTIARAFLAKPTLLLLDEATSSVDTRTEVLVQRAMRDLRAGRTSFVIAHRLSTIRDASVILVMEGGAIVERGTHAELLAAGGAYARLYQAQFARAEA